MGLAGVHDELRGAAEPPQRLVQLLAVLDRYVPVDVAAHDQRGRDDLLDRIERRQPLPHRARPPRQAQLLLPFVLVVVVTVVGDVQHLTGAADRRCEAGGPHDHVVGENAAVRPAAHSQAFGIGDPLPDRVVHARHDVVVILVAPIREDRLAECLAVSRAARRDTARHSARRSSRIGATRITTTSWRAWTTRSGRGSPIPNAWEWAAGLTAAFSPTT